MSKRQDRKLARGAAASRPNRRAEKRHKVAMVGYDIACKVSKNSAGYKKPGAKKCW